MRSPYHFMFLLLVGIGLVYYGVGVATLAGASTTGGNQTDHPRSEPEACPTGFWDIACFASGGGSDPLIDQAIGEAMEICQGKHAECYTTQGQERETARTACEAVAGCKFTSTSDIEFCSSNMAADCIPPPGQSTNRNTIYLCTAHGLVDHEGYECKRPAPTGGNGS